MGSTEYDGLGNNMYSLSAKYGSRTKVISPAMLMFTFALGFVSNSFGATLSVPSYGATGDGLTDDTAAIQKASDACSGGSTLLFPAGNYRVTQPLTAHAGCSYVGAVGAMITGYTGTGTGGFSIFQTDGNNITFSGLTLNGGGINLAGSGWSDHITITNNVIQNIVNSNPDWGPQLSSIWCGGFGMQNTTITGNTFQNSFTGGNNNLAYPDDSMTAIVCPRVNAVTIADNIFDNLNEGIHIVEAHDPGTYDKLQIQRNKFTRIHRMPIEIQTWYLTNTLIEDNSMTNYLNPFWNSFGISFAENNATGAIIRRNHMVMDKTAALFQGANSAGMCLEVAGTGTLVDSNVCESVSPGSWGIALSIGPWNPSTFISNNTFCGANNGTIFPTVGTQVGKAAFINNKTPGDCTGVVSPVQSVPPPTAR